MLLILITRNRRILETTLIYRRKNAQNARAPRPFYRVRGVRLYTERTNSEEVVQSDFFSSRSVCRNDNRSDPRRIWLSEPNNREIAGFYDSVPVDRLVSW